MLGLAAEIDEAAASIREIWKGEPRVGLILGTGLGGLTAQIEQEAVIAYDD
ncbi:MAG: purine-nucleoside phosphorylase, partial [Rhodopirellula sp.]|nr:purine-nucleoside phosphorylase [Rhodopirellula sp.]